MRLTVKMGYTCSYLSRHHKGSDVSVEEHKSHRSSLSLISYSHYTNFLSSAGYDGNLCIHCIYELSGWSSYEDNQITLILNEGLGDNVSYPLSSIFIQN